MDETKNEMNREEMQPNGYEHMSDSATPNAPKTNQTSKKMLIIGAVSLIVVSSVLLVCMAMGLFIPRQPWERTLDAVFPSFSMLESMAMQGGRVTLDASIASDLSDRVREKPLRLHAEAALGRGGLMISGSLGGDQHMADVALVADAKGVQIYSERLLDGGYSVASRGLMEAIDGSIFAPDSGTDYALPREVYDALKKYVDAMKDPERDVMEFEEIRAVLEHMAEKVMETAEVTREDATLSLVDGEAKVKLTVITFDVSAIEAIKDILLDEWKNNPAFYEELCELFDVYSGAASGGAAGTEVDIDEVMDALYQQIKASLGEYIKTAKKNDFQLQITHATRGGYLVYASLDSHMMITINKNGIRKKTGSTYTLTFASDPNSNASFDLVMDAYDGDKKEKPLTVTYRQENDRFTLAVDTELKALTVEGSHVVRGDKVVLSVDGIKQTVGDEVTLEMTDSAFTLTLAKGNQRVKRADNDTDLLSMTVEDMEALRDKVEQGIDKFKADVNAELGFDLIYDVLTKRTQGLLSREEYHWIYDYAYDEKSGHLFLAVEEQGQYYVEMYELETMKLLRRIMVDGKVALDADNGYVAYGVMNGGDFEIYILNAHSFDTFLYLPLKGVSGIENNFIAGQDLYLDGDVLICLVGSWDSSLVFVNFRTQQLLSVSPSYKSGTIALDRGNHLVAIKDGNAQQSRLSIYDSLTGAHRCDSPQRWSYNGAPLYFDGTGFAFDDFHFTTDGQFYDRESMLTDRKPEDSLKSCESLIYKDDTILVTKEYENSELYSMFYALTGQKGTAPAFEKLGEQWYQSIVRIGEREYMAVYYTQGSINHFEHFTIEDGVDIDF